MAVQFKTYLKNRGAIVFWAALFFCAVILLAGTAGTGLWDPWEMNHAAVARRMMQPEPVLVIDHAGPDGALAGAVRGAGDSLKVQTVTAKGSVALDKIRDLTSDEIFAAVVIDAASMPASGDAEDEPAALRSLSNTIRNVASRNLSTLLILVSSGSGTDVERLRADILESDAAAPAEDRVSGLGGILVAAPADKVPDLVKKAAHSAAMTAQFKSGGRTMFLPPLEPGLSSLSYRIFGYNEFGSRFAGVFFGALIILLIVFPARRLFGREIAGASMLILGTSMLFSGAARFVGTGMSEVFSVALGTVAFGMVITPDESGRTFRKVAWWVTLGLSVILCWLAGGMTATVTLAAIVGAWFVVNPKTEHLPAVGMVLALLGLLALATFIPDCAWARQFRFTAATFAGGVDIDSRSFDFIIKEVGFGFFPWSAFLPVALWAAATGRGTDKPARLLLLLWAVIPMIVAMVLIRPFNQNLYLGLPGMAILTALFFVESTDSAEDARFRTRLFGFFAAGLFIVMMKDMSHSPAPLVSFLTVDPMFSKPGQGNGGFPPSAHLPVIGKLFLGFMLLSLLAVTAEAVDMARLVVRFMSKRRTFVVILIVLLALIVIDIAVFTSMKWRALTSGGERAQSELLRILLTGPDILGLYLVTGLAVLLHFWDRVAGLLARILGSARFARLSEGVDALQTLKVQKVVFGLSAAGFAMVLMFLVNPGLALHLSQKHIVDTWKKAAKVDPGQLFRHGAFTNKGAEDNNFYTSGLEEIESRSEVTRMLADKSKRTFFLLPTRQFSEINSAWRDVTGGRGLPVLDDRSSRIVLATSRLAQGETDHNWLTKATLTMDEFEKLQDVDRISVNFEDSAELIGFQITPQAITRGTNPVLKMYYKVNRKISKSYRVFMHVDRVGSSTRIHGDHWMLNLVPESEDQDDCIGCYATNHWKKGDVIVDTYELQVPIGSPSGDYDVWMGLYVPGGGRMKVKSWDEKKIKNDGSDRVRIGKMTVR